MSTSPPATVAPRADSETTTTPPARRRDRLARAPWPVALVFLVAVLVLASYALDVHLVQNDEHFHIQVTRYVFSGEHFPGSLFEMDVYVRGLQRLYLWLIGPPLGLLHSPADLQTARLITVIAYCATALPTYWLGRMLGLDRWVATIVGGLALLVPWAVVSTAFLTENLAYPLFMATLAAIVHTATRPGIRADLLVLALLGLMVLTRVNLAVVLVAIYAATLLTTARFSPGRWRATARNYLREHRLLAVIGLIGVTVWLLNLLGIVSLSTLLGSYDEPLRIHWDELRFRTETFVARVAAGVAFIPFAVGLAWMVRETIRPREAVTNAFAVAALLACLGVLFTTLRTGFDERYVMYLAPPLFLATAVALTRLPVAWPWLVASGALMLHLVLKATWLSDPGPYAVFANPANIFYGRVVQGHVQSDAKLIVLIALALGVVVFAATRLGRAWRIGLVVLAGICVYQAAQSYYVVHGYVRGLAGGTGVDDPPSASERAFLTKAADGRSVAGLPVSAGNTGGYSAVWRELAFWNGGVHDMYFLDESPGVPVPLGWAATQGHVDPGTGRVSGPQPPDVVALIRAFRRTELVGSVIGGTQYIPVDVMDVARPARARFLIEGPTPDGWIESVGKPAHVKVWGGGLPAPACANVGLSAPQENVTKPKPWRVSVGDTVRRGKLKAGESTSVSVPLPALPQPGQTARVTIAGDGRTKLADGRTVTVNVAGFGVGACPS